MTTITIQEDINLSKTIFSNYEELVNFIISSSSWIEIEVLTTDEKDKINNLKEYKDFKKTANSISF